MFLYLDILGSEQIITINISDNSGYGDKYLYYTVIKIE
jgi:hypothetical protein